jgi:hypothetical protein
MNTKIASAILVILACATLFIGYSFLSTSVMEARQRLQTRITTMP